MANRILPVLSDFNLTVALPEHTDNQVTGNYSQCKRRTYYGTVLGRRRIGMDEIALRWGTVFHKGTEILTTTQDMDHLQWFIDRHLDENHDDRYGRTRGRMFEALITWVNWRKTNPIKVLRTEQPTVIRCESACPYFEDGCHLEYGGLMDEIVDWQGYVGPLDFKTTVMTDSDPVTNYRMDHQMMGYDWIASHLVGRHCWGAIVERIITNKSSIKIDRIPIPYSKDQIREWVENERELQQDLVMRANLYPNDESKWEQNYMACNNPYKCTFFDVCLAPKSMNFRYKWLRDNTEEKRWNFLERDAADEADYQLYLASKNG